MILAAPKVIAPVLAIIMPPVPENAAVHSGPAVRGDAVLYVSVAPAPYVGATEVDAVPAIVRILFTVTPAVVLRPELLRVRL